jgi:hypothetical protein
MKLLSKKTLALLGLITMAPITANAATVNLDALSNTNLNPVELNLTAGTYNVNPFMGAYTSWNAWGTVSGCDSNGANCSKGWINNYSITTPTETIFTSNGVRYKTADLALLNALSTSFTLLSDATVKFFIKDSNYSDNIGGISLNVSSVPVPAAAFLFAPALLGFMGLRRKAKNSVA